jgi:hypothetical protein
LLAFCRYGMMSVYDEKRESRMKRRPTAILLILAAVVVIGLVVILLARPGKQPSAGGEDVRLYYYRSIPGLKRAEEAGKVLSLRKSFALDDKRQKIEIDRLWIGDDTAWALYHTDGSGELSVSGTLELADEDGSVTLYAAAPGDTEKISADGGLYGYFVMRRAEGSADIGVVKQGSLWTVVARNRWPRKQVTELDPIPITVSESPGEEISQDIPLVQAANELGALGVLTPKQITLAQSGTILSVDWESGQYELYGLTGTLASRTGEKLPLDGRVEAGRIKLPAFNYPDVLYTLSLDRAYFRYPGSLTMTIDPKDYQKRGSRKEIGQPAFAPGGPQCILDRVRVEKDWVYLDMNPVDAGSGTLCADPWDEGRDTGAVGCLNGASGRIAGALSYEGDILTIAVPRGMWDQELKIWIQIRDPLISLESGIDIDFRGE